MRPAYYAFAACFSIFLILYALRGIGWLTMLPGGIFLTLALGSWFTGLWSVLTFLKQRY
ncbi:hypothetical protein NK55_10590 [Thermosynechococcus sp. NK55a]|uniref:hypothetical protein n=1 Tax=unclassified Thermosynechococcus TaxID=2622553 RepID=UPI0003D91DAE|nr:MULTISPECIES: hypothetical protein [unclassified Thermosynechococcus]AHB89358.1 hypothetical protein NK55_10590 [Thermosynechococcus sp. NK55a]RMH63537.1 MAG: hypothetical protein D6676_11260 [Cyanobacteria bacterium J003]HIK23371.1 hypothetical protein [Thermosynechococcus sp. M3746_W2019_013]